MTSNFRNSINLPWKNVEIRKNFIYKENWKAWVASILYINHIKSNLKRIFYKYKRQISWIAVSLMEQGRRLKMVSKKLSFTITSRTLPLKTSHASLKCLRCPKRTLEQWSTPSLDRFNFKIKNLPILSRGQDTNLLDRA